MYDEEEGGRGTYYEDLKKEVSEQAETNRSEFTGLREEVRVQYEGMRPGCYVRMEIKSESECSRGLVISAVSAHTRCAM